MDFHLFHFIFIFLEMTKSKAKLKLNSPNENENENENENRLLKGQQFKLNERDSRIRKLLIEELLKSII